METTSSTPTNSESHKSLRNQCRFIANDPSFPLNIRSGWFSGRFTVPMPILQHLLRQAGSLLCTPQGCMQRHGQRCGTIFHPIGVQTIADDHHIRLFLWEEMRRKRWMFWKKKENKTWTNTILNLLWVQVPQKGIYLELHKPEFESDPSAESCSGFGKLGSFAKPLAPATGRHYLFWSRLFPSQLGLEYREYLCRLLREISLTTQSSYDGWT